MAVFWLTYLHVFSVFLFLLIHGVSIGIVLSLRKERDPKRVTTLLEISRNSVGYIHGSLFLVLATGIALGFLGNWWGYLWIWVALGGMIALWVIMGLMGTRYYDKARRSVGVVPFYGQKEFTPDPSGEPKIDELNRLLSSSRPVVLVLLGLFALAVMLWLMFYKPF